MDKVFVATALTACGMRRRVRDSRGVKRRWGPPISSPWPKGGENEKDGVNVPTACGIETWTSLPRTRKFWKLQQYLPLAVCDEGGETAEEQSDDEVCTSLVPDRREVKTKRIEWMCLLLAVLKQHSFDYCSSFTHSQLQQYLLLAVLKRAWVSDSLEPFV